MPLSSSTSPEAELLKRILQQMVENERKRVRNDFIRIVLSFTIVLLLLLGGAFWLSYDILQKFTHGRQVMEHSRQERATLMPQHQSVEQAPEQPDSHHALEAESKPLAGGAHREKPFVQLPPPEPPIPPSGEKKTEEDPPAYANSMTIQIKGGLPMRAPIPKP